MWGDKKVDPLEQVTDTEDGAPASKTSKADEHEEEILQIVDQLASKHSENSSAKALG